MFYRYPQKVSGMAYGSLWHWVWVYHIIATLMEHEHVGLVIIYFRNERVWKEQTYHGWEYCLHIYFSWTIQPGDTWGTNKKTQQFKLLGNKVGVVWSVRFWINMLGTRSSLGLCRNHVPTSINCFGLPCSPWKMPTTWVALGYPPFFLGQKHLEIWPSIYYLRFAFPHQNGNIIQILREPKWHD